MTLNQEQTEVVNIIQANTLSVGRPISFAQFVCEWLRTHPEDYLYNLFTNYNEICVDLGYRKIQYNTATRIMSKLYTLGLVQRTRKESSTWKRGKVPIQRSYYALVPTQIDSPKWKDVWS